MSKWSAKRKRRILIIIGVVLLFFIVLFFIRAENRKQPSCFDGIQNGAETGVDCGGICARMCSEEVRNLVVWWERPFRVTNGVYNVVAYVENQNLDAGLEYLEYEFRLYDKNNIIASEPVRGATFIEPNKRTAIFESGVVTGDNEPHTVFFRVLSRPDWKRTSQDFAYNLFSVSDPVLSNQDSTPKLSARITNSTLINFSEITVAVIIYNERGNAIATSQTYLPSLDQGSTQQIFYSWPLPFTESVSRIEIIPRLNPYLDYEGLTR